MLHMQITINSLTYLSELIFKPSLPRSQNASVSSHSHNAIETIVWYQKSR